MCGIAGYMGPRPPSPEHVQACLSLMHHRGPDAKGAYHHAVPNGRHIVLLHSRLAIIDLDPRGNQPFRRGTLALAYNGEIYNYAQLRQELRREGLEFSTDCDTEVLACGLSHWPIERLLDAAEGMWAFAAYDETADQLVLSRDRFGEKPLYLAWDDDGGLYFGSEVKFLSALRGRPFAPNLNHVRRYLVNGYKALYKSAETFHQGVSELPAGCNLVIASDGRAEEKRYWTPQPRENSALSFKDSVSLVRDSLIKAVGLRLRADVPLAFCMSGGVDSNALISIAKRVFGYDVHGFTIVNTDARYEEQDIVARAVTELGVRHTAIPLDSRDFLNNLRKLVRAHDAPVYTLSYYVHWRLMEAVGQAGYKVSISGTGADELFTGYYDHHNFYLAEMHAEAGRHGAARDAWRTHVQPIVRNPYLGDPDYLVRTPLARDHIYLGADSFTDDLTEPWSEAFTERDLHPRPLRNRMLNELFEEVVPVILHEDDLNAMYFSIENRSPFLDRGLFDAIGAVPTRHLIRDGYAKAVLREAVRGIAPDAVVDCRRKVGFNAPLLELLDVADPRVRDELLADSPIYQVIRRDRVMERLAKGALANSESKFLFNVLNVKMFLEECGGTA